MRNQVQHVIGAARRSEDRRDGGRLKSDKSCRRVLFSVDDCQPEPISACLCLAQHGADCRVESLDAGQEKFNNRLIARMDRERTVGPVRKASRAHRSGVLCLDPRQALVVQVRVAARYAAPSPLEIGIIQPTRVSPKPSEKAMPSASLQYWLNDRLLRLNEIETQCAASQALVPPNQRLREENLRGYIVLLSAHFQGFCRDLYTESAQITTIRVRATLRILIQAQFTAHRALDHGNPNLQNLRKDYERFGFTLNLAAADQGNPARLQDLIELNKWRNIAAHHGTVPPAGLPSLADLQDWRNSCNGLAVSLDGIMYNELRRILRRTPWVP